MTIYMRTAGNMMEARRRMMRRMVEDSFNTERLLNFPMELKSSNDEYTISAMLPGLTAEDVNIEFNNGLLSINGEYQEIREDNVEYLFSELPAGRFNRTLELSEPVVSDKIEASMKNGVLTIRIPKAEEAKPKTIKIVAK